MSQPRIDAARAAGYGALVIDDEPIARAGLRSMLAAHPEFRVIGEARNGIEAVDSIRRLRPDVVFLDVRMPDRDGFRVLEALEAFGAQSRLAVVFATAHADFALRAFHVGAVDYLLKPFDHERLARTLERVTRYLRGATDHERAPSAPTGAFTPSAPHRILVRNGGELTFVDASEVERIEADGNYLHVIVRGNRYSMRGTLGTFAARLDRGAFVRISRSIVVNVRRVSVARPLPSGQYEIRLEDGDTVLSSRRYRREVREALS